MVEIEPVLFLVGISSHCDFSIFHASLYFMTAIHTLICIREVKSGC